MAEKESGPLLVLSKNDPKGILELPDGCYQVFLKYMDSGSLEVESSESSQIANTAAGKGLNAIKDSMDIFWPQASARISMRKLFVSKFSESELCTLCFDLELRYDSFAGEGVGDKVREILDYFFRRGKQETAKLVSYLERERKDVYRLLPAEVKVVQQLFRAPEDPFSQQRGYKSKID